MTSSLKTKRISEQELETHGEIHLPYQLLVKPGEKGVWFSNRDVYLTFRNYVLTSQEKIIKISSKSNIKEDFLGNLIFQCILSLEKKFNVYATRQKFSFRQTL